MGPIFFLGGGIISNANVAGSFYIRAFFWVGNAMTPVCED